MREILYRGKPKNEADYELYEGIHKDNCKNGFVYGSLVIKGKQYYICVNVPFMENTYAIFSNVTLFEVIPETVGEYTALKDENGQRIFEGDIVITKHNGQHNAYSIIYDEEFATFIGRDKDNFNFTTLSCLDSSQLEVIANIHDNPELLKG